MSDQPLDDELDPEEDEPETDDDFERAPQPGNTPDPDEPPYDSGAITSRDDL